MTGAGRVNVVVMMGEGMSVVVGGGGIVAGEGGSGVYEVTGENRPIFVESDVFYSLDDLI